MSSKRSSGVTHPVTAQYTVPELLHICANFLNNAGFKLGTPLTVEDFGNLSSDVMVSIMVELLGCVNQAQDFTQSQKPLEEFNKLGVGHVTYDGRMDAVYHAVKRILPAGHKFHYSNLLLPSSNPKGCMQVIADVTQFVLLTRALEVRFGEVYDQVAEEVRAKWSLSQEVGELRARLDYTIQRRVSGDLKMTQLAEAVWKMKKERVEKEKVLALLNLGVVKLENRDLQEQIEQEMKSRRETEREIAKLRNDDVRVKRLEGKTDKVMSQLTGTLGNFQSAFNGFSGRSEHRNRMVELKRELREHERVRVETMSNVHEEKMANRSVCDEAESVRREAERNGQVLGELLWVYEHGIPNRFNQMEDAAVEVAQDATDKLTRFAPL